MHASRWPAWLRKASLWLFVAFFVLYFYTFLHEAGHGLAAVLFGGQVLAINVDFITMGAHVRTAGAFTPLQNSLKSLAGPGLPVLTWAAFMLAVPRRAGLALELVKTLSTLMVLNSTLPWVVIPLLYTKGLAPAGDDATRFLRQSGASPLWVAGAALALYVAGWGLYLRKIKGLREEIWLLQAPVEGLGLPSRRALMVMAVTLALGVVLLVGINSVA